MNPFSRNLLNKIETFSLLVLTGICFLNLIPAYNYAYPSIINAHFVSVRQIQLQTETVLTLVFLFLIGLYASILIIIRILQAVLRYVDVLLG